MKYNQQLYTQLQSLPTSLRAACISYKSWKKLLKNPAITGDNIKIALLQDCKQIHETLSIEMQQYDHYPVEHYALLLRFADTNATTLRKVCKRIDKCRPELQCNALEWLIVTRQQHIYAFLQGPTHTRLSLLVQPTLVECPICYSTVKPGKVMIATCGHYYCSACVKQLSKRLQLPYNPAVDALVYRYTYIVCPQCTAVCDIKACEKLLTPPKKHCCV